MAKWTLTIEEEGGQTHRVELTRDAYTIGRDPSNDIVFRERNISRRHARFERAGPGRWALIDEGSRFGCFINGERVQGRGVISPVDAIHLGGYHLSILSSSGKRGLQPALSVTRSLLVPLDVPPKLRLFDGLAPVADVRLDRGPVSFGSDSDCTVRLLGVEGALVHIRPLPGGSFEIVDRGDVVLVRLKGQELRRKILENADLFDLGDDLAIRFLQGGRHARTDEPDFSPSPLVDLSNGVAETKVLGVEGVPVLRQGPQKAAASSTLVGLQAPRPPPLPARPSATPTDVAWHPEQQDTPTHPEGFHPPPPSADPPTTRTPYDASGSRPPQASPSARPAYESSPSARPPAYESPSARQSFESPSARQSFESPSARHAFGSSPSARPTYESSPSTRPAYESSPSARPPAYESPSGQLPYEGGVRPSFESSAGRTAEMPAGRPPHEPMPGRTAELPAMRPMHDQPPVRMGMATERLAPVPASQQPMAQSDDSWTSGAPAADMGWPMGQHQPSSVPNPPPDAWWFAGAAGPSGQNFAQRLHNPPPGPPPMRRGVVALVILGPLAAGVLVTALLVAKLRPAPTLTTTDETEVTIQTINDPAAGSGEPAASAAPSVEVPASAAPEAPVAPAASDSAAPRQVPGKPGRPGKPLNAEAERLRQLRCQQYGKCDLVRIRRRSCET